MKGQYMKPTVMMVSIQQQQHLLTLSGRISGYSKSDSGFSQEEPTVEPNEN